MNGAQLILLQAALASWAAATTTCQASCPTTTAPLPSTSIGPDWFQTSPGIYQGAIATGDAPFLAETNPAVSGQKTYSANSPLVTDQSIHGAKGRNIFHLMGDMSPYFSTEDGFGVGEHSIPPGSNITQMHMLHRHGARYPSGDSMASWAEGILNHTTAGNRFTGPLSFLNRWNYGLGSDLLVPLGRQELFNSGVLNYYNYGHLYNKNLEHKLVVRTTTQHRMLESAENFLAGFFGLDWSNKVNLLPIIEHRGFNNSLMSMYSGPNSISKGLAGPATYEPMYEWIGIYLTERTAVFNKLGGSYKWTANDTYNAQSLCAYETVAYGSSPFCQLFTYEEFEGFAYSWDLLFSIMSGFRCPTGRAQGIAGVEEFLARVQGHTLQTTKTNANMTLDNNTVTFPTDQNLYLDFTHDSGIVAVLTAFGFTQFAQYLPPTGPPPNQQFRSSDIVPFAGRMNIEIIHSPE